MSASARLYAANLIGSGLGCFLPLTLLGPLDGEHLFGLFALLAWSVRGAVSCGARRRSRAARREHRDARAAASQASCLPIAVFPIQPEPPPFGQLAGQYAVRAEHRHPREKQVRSLEPDRPHRDCQFKNVPGGPEPYPAMFYAQDSTAGSSLVHWDGRDAQRYCRRPRTQARSSRACAPRRCTARATYVRATACW